MIAHDGTRRLTEHIFQLDINRFNAICLFEDKLHIVGSFTYDIHRGTFTFSNTSYPFYVFFFHQQAHTFLAFITDDFLCRQGRITNWQLTHIDMSTGCFHQFRQTVQMTASSVVVDRNNRIIFRFGNRTNHVSRTLLHLRIGTLYSVQLDTTRILSGIY